MIAVIKGVSISPESYQFSVKYKNYDGTTADLVEQVTVPRQPPREMSVIIAECETQVRERLRHFIMLISVDNQVAEYVRIGYQVEEV